MIRIVVLWLTAAASLCAQAYGPKNHFDWTEYCFRNPKAPFCLGHDFINKPKAGAKDAPGNAIANGGTVAHETQIVTGGIDWRFADPSADALIGFNFAGIAASPFARGLIAHLGARLGGNHGTTQADMQKIVERMAGVERVVISVRDNHAVAMVTGGDAK